MSRILTTQVARRRQIIYRSKCHSPMNPVQVSVDDRRFAIENRDGEFVRKFVGTAWETVKRELVWTIDKDQAATWDAV